MTTGMSGPIPYRVSYSERVLQRLRHMVDIARERGDAEELVAAMEEFDRRLKLYPQFGEPLVDLAHEKGQIWIGTVPPLTMRYAVLDDRRKVTVGSIQV